MTTNNEKIRILGKGITALALKDKFPNATLYDDNDFNQYDLNSNEYTVVSPGTNFDFVLDQDENNITYHGSRNRQPIWNRNKTVGTG